MHRYKDDHCDKELTPKPTEITYEMLKLENENLRHEIQILKALIKFAGL